MKKLLLLMFVIILLSISCAPSQKEIDKYYYEEVIDTTEYNKTIDSLKNVNIDSLLNEIIKDIQEHADTSAIL